MTRLPLLLVLVLGLAACGGSSGEPAAEPSGELSVSPDGWRTDFGKHVVPLDQFLAGGPPKDGIPAIDEPVFVGVDEADFVKSREPVIELVVGGEARAYPIQILIWHEIVNDEIAGVPVAVTFCPLCNTALVFDRRLGGRTLDFGTTGNLRHSDLVMYDRQTETWWQQFGGRGLVGELAGERLEPLPARLISWEAFARKHPDGRVLSTDTGHSRPYGANPYVGYDQASSGPIFPAAGHEDDRLEPKERVVFVERGEEAAVVPFSALEGGREVELELAGEPLTVRAVGEAASALDRPSIPRGASVLSVEVLADGELVAHDTPFWFAVAAFRPDAQIVR